MSEVAFEAVGWFGVFLFSVCPIPQVIECWRNRSARDVSWAFLIMWQLGEILTLIYTSGQEKILLPLIVNYVFNIILISIILYWKWYGGNNERGK